MHDSSIEQVHENDEYLRRLIGVDCAQKVAPKAVYVARATRLSIRAERPDCLF